MYDVIIAGSGPAATAALSGLPNDARVLIIDAAFPQENKKSSALDELLAEGRAKEILGDRFEYLEHLGLDFPPHPKLRGSKNSAINKNGRLAIFYDSNGTQVNEVRSSSFRGGFSQVWGAQLYRYTQSDLNFVGNWPVQVTDLQQHYEWLESKIKDLGFTLDSNPQINAAFLSENSKLLLKRASGAKSRLLAEPSRVGIRREDKYGNPSSAMNKADFIEPHGEDVFTSNSLLSDLLLRNKMSSIEEGATLETWDEKGGEVKIYFRDKNGKNRVEKSKNLILACGTLETSALVLEHENQLDYPLPFVDHPPFLLPVLSIRTAFSKFPKFTFPVQLSLSLKSHPRDVAISFYSPTGVLRSELLKDIPLDVRLATKVLPVILPMLGVLQVWQTAMKASANEFFVRKDRTIAIHYQDEQPTSEFNGLIRALAKLGFITSRKLLKKPIPGWGFHYAGTLPMRADPSLFETHIDGRLWNSKRVFVVDGSVLPSLPPLNHSLTLMANARRIASGIKI